MAGIPVNNELAELQYSHKQKKENSTMKRQLIPVVLILTLLSACKKGDAIPSPPPHAAGACEYEYELKSKYSTEDYNKVAPELGLNYLGTGGSIKLDFVKKDVIDIIVEKPNEPLIARATTVMHWAKCMEETDEKFSQTGAFKKKKPEEQAKWQEQSYQKINDFRSRALAMLLEKQGVNVSAQTPAGAKPADKAFLNTVITLTEQKTKFYQQTLEKQMESLKAIK